MRCFCRRDYNSFSHDADVGKRVSVTSRISNKPACVNGFRSMSFIPEEMYDTISFGCELLVMEMIGVRGSNLRIKLVAATPSNLGIMISLNPKKNTHTVSVPSGKTKRATGD